MRIPRVRITVRRLMLLVTITGTLGGGALTMERRAADCRARAAHYRNLAGCGTHFGIPKIDARADHYCAMRDR